MRARIEVRILAAVLAALVALPAAPAAALAATATLTLSPTGTVTTTYGDAAIFSATLVDPAGPMPIAGASISFSASPFTGGGDPTALGNATTDATGEATLDANPVTVLGGGRWLVTARWAGDDTWDPATSTATDLTVNPAAQTIDFDPPADRRLDQSPTTVSATATSGLPVTFDSLTTTVCTVSGATVTLHTIGSCTILASQGGDASYLPAPTVDGSFTVAKGNQVITFAPDAPTTAKANGPAYVPAATASSGLAVTSFAASPISVCQIKSGAVTFKNAGTCTVTANQPGDGNWNAAPQASHAIAVTGPEATTTIVASSRNPSTYGDGVTFTATVSPSTATGTVQFVVDGAGFGAPVAVAGGTATSGSISTLAGGTHAVQASFTPNDIVAWATSSGTLAGGQVVARAGQAITFGDLAGRTYGDGPFGVSATATSGLAVTFGSLTPGVCTVAGTTVTIVGSGTCTIRASQAGNADYDAAPDVDRDFTVGKKSVTVTANSASRPYGAANPVLTATLTGLVGGDDPGTPSCSTAAGPASGIGPYPITCAAGSLSTADYTYTFVNVGAALLVTRAPLTVTAQDRVRPYGTPNPSLVATLTGFVLGQSAASAGVTGMAACTTTALVTTNVGAVPITCGAGTLAAADYAFVTFVPGTLTIEPAPAVPTVVSSTNPSPAGAPVTFTARVAWPVGTPAGTVAFAIDGVGASGPLTLVDGAASYSTSSLPLGDHAVTVAYTPDPGATNFAAATAPPFIQSIGTTAVDVTLGSDLSVWETRVPITFTATLRPRASVVTVPVTGRVVFAVDGVDKASVPVAGSAAAYLSPALAAGAHTVTARYVRDIAAVSYFTVGAPGALARTVIVNTVKASSVGVSSSSVYPVRDAWKDTVAIRGTRNERASVAIRVYSPTGRKVRSTSIAAGTGAYAYSWNGRSSSGTILAAGRYRVVQVLTDAHGTRKSVTSYVTLSRKRMYWYTKTITVSPGPRRFGAASDTSIQALYSTTSTRPLVMANGASTPAWKAVGYQFTLPSASTYASLSFRVQGSWTGTTAPKIGLIPWNGGSWSSMYDTSRKRTAMGTSTTTFYRQTITNLAGIRSGRSVRGVIDSFAGPSGYAVGPFRYSITGVRLVVKYGVLR